MSVVVAELVAAGGGGGVGFVGGIRSSSRVVLIGIDTITVLL